MKEPTSDNPLQLTQEQREEMRAKDDAKRKRQLEVTAQYGPRAQVVEPYQPNRKQRRAQAAAERKGGK